MKKLIALLFLAFFMTSTGMAQEWWIKPSAGVLMATVDDKIVMGDEEDAGILEGYEGGAGTEARVSVGNNMIETSYILQYYSADKDGNITIKGNTIKEKGEITFVNEMIDVATYIFDAAVKTGFNFSVGLGTGVSKITLENRSLGGTAQDDYTEYANKLFSSWGIGEKDKDNGALIFLAHQERKIRIEVGYGLEGILPDGRVGEILDRYALPFFKKGEYGRGLYGAALAVAAIIAKDAGVTLTGVPKRFQRNISQRPSSLGGFFGSIIPLLILFFIIGGRRGILPWLLLGGMMTGRSNSGFGGGFGSGGFGGGFGGGLSGGGGAGRGF